MTSISVEIADTPMKRETGLQFAKELGELSGMLFKFQSPSVLSFWMRNTYIPLDIAFIDEDGVIVNTERMTPLSLRSIKSARPCSLALEVPAGTLGRIGAEPGTMVTIDWDKKTISMGRDDNDNLK